MIRVYLCDEEPQELERYESWLRRAAAGHRIPIAINRFLSIQALDFALADLGCPDILFLDILMGSGKNGVEAAKKLRAEGCTSALIFLTASCDHAISAFEAHPFHCLLKGAGFERFQAIFLECAQALEERKRELFCYAAHSALHCVPLAKILYFEVQGHTAVLHCAAGSEAFPMSLCEIQRRLAGKPFVRLHRAYLVNAFHVSRLSAREAVLFSGEALPISRSYGPAARAQIARFLACRSA